MTVTSSGSRNSENLVAGGVLTFAIIGAIAAGWRVLVFQTATLAYLEVVLEVVGILIILLAIPAKPELRQFIWDGLRGRRSWQVGAFVIGIVFWTVFVFFPAYSYTVEACTAAQSHGSRAELEAYLTAEAAHATASYFGVDVGQVQLVGGPEFHNGADLGQVCAKATYVSR